MFLSNQLNHLDFIFTSVTLTCRKVIHNTRPCTFVHVHAQHGPAKYSFRESET